MSKAVLLTNPSESAFDTQAPTTELLFIAIPVAVYKQISTIAAKNDKTFGEGLAEAVDNYIKSHEE